VASTTGATSSAFLVNALVKLWKRLGFGASVEGDGDGTGAGAATGSVPGRGGRAPSVDFMKSKNPPPVCLGCLAGFTGLEGLGLILTIATQVNLS